MNADLIPLIVPPVLVALSFWNGRRFERKHPKPHPLPDAKPAPFTDMEISRYAIIYGRLSDIEQNQGKILAAVHGHQDAVSATVKLWQSADGNISGLAKTIENRADELHEQLAAKNSNWETVVQELKSIHERIKPKSGRRKISRRAS